MTEAPWLLLMFTLPAKQSSRRVEVWRKLRKYGALPLRASGYLLPNRSENEEKFEWLAAAIRKYQGRASVVQVQAIDDLPSEKLVQLFMQARRKDYEGLSQAAKRLVRQNKPQPGELARLRRRFQEITAIDFFNNPLRGRVEALLENANAVGSSKVTRKSSQKFRQQYLACVWVTRPRPGIDRVSSAWLICRFVDAKARFVFGNQPQAYPDAIPFDMFQTAGFGHRGDDCTFETLRKEFAIVDPKVATIAEIIHDADLADEKFGRTEGTALDRVLIGWAELGISDDELLRRGMELIEGLYQSLS